ncbi:DUF4209 domain-containing protein [Lactovum odontotermitis]
MKKMQYKAYLKEKAEDYHSADFAGNLLVKIARKENDTKAEKEAWLLVANGWEKMSEMMKDRPMIVKADAMSKAADAYKKGGDDVGYSRCLMASQESLRDKSGWKSYSYSIDLKCIIDRFEQKFNGASINKKILLIMEFTKISHDTVRNRFEDNKKANPLYGLFNSQTIDDKGIVRSSTKEFATNNKNEDETFLIKEAINYINLQSYIIVFFNQRYILSEIDNVTFSEIIKPLLPENVRMIDYILRTALSGYSEIVIEPLLISFESFLAALLEQNGLSSIKQLEDKDVQEDLTMGALLAKCKEHNLIEEDDAFLLEALLCNKNGLNLRNLSSHRLTSDSGRFNVTYLFCSYFLLRLLMKY